MPPFGQLNGNLWAMATLEVLGKSMESEIREQPSVLSANAPRYAQELCEFLGSQAPFDMVLLAARGSSDNAATYGRYLFEIHVGIPVSLAAPSVITRYKRSIRYPRCLAIGISQSGAAPDVAEVLLNMKEQGHTTLGITNTEGSKITQIADKTLLLGVGNEQSVAATKTYTASLLAMHEIVRALGGDLAEPVLPGDAWIEETELAALRSSGPVVRSSPVFALARGYGFSTALETALKLMECSLIPCKPYSSADFEHGPKALAGHGSAAISYSGPMEGLTGQGCEIIEAPKAPVHETIAPIWDVIFGQWLALQTARARGLNPDQARHLKKVTETL